MNKRQKRGLTLLGVGLILVLSALGLHLAQQQEDAAAGQASAVLLEKLDQRSLPVEDTPVAKDPELPIKKYMDYSLIGSISIPSVGIRLPVLDDWNEDMLKVAPCRYAGSISGGDMILMGHNYKSHFNPLHNIREGAEVEFENTAGRVYRYRVAKIEKLHRTQGELLPDPQYPLTIFTCAPGGVDRVVVRCEIA